MVGATVSQPPENVTAVWNDGAYEISWNIPENSGASKSIVSIVENDAIVYEEELDVNEMEFIYKSEPKSDIRFIVRTVSGTGVASAGIKATKSGLASTVTFDGNDILLKGVTDGGNLVAFTAIPNGGDASSVNDLAAMGSIEVNKDKTFTSKVALNDKTSVSSDFIIYVGDEKEKQTKYISYINDSDVFSDILVTYNHDGYDIHWNLNRDDVEKVMVSDGSNSVEYSHEEGYTFSECDNIKKTFTITALCSDGGEEKKEISAPIPLGINCRVVDGIVYVRGTAQPADSVQINVVSDENLILAKTVTADEWGGFETNFIIEDSKITSDEKFILQIITKSDMDKTTEFIYTGSLPVHIESEDGKVSFTNYYSKKIEKSQAIVAFYDGEKLAECKVYDISINPGEKIVPDIEYYAQQGYKVKIFLWNGLNAMKPLSRVYAR